MTQEELLKYAINNGMINLDEVSAKANMKLIEKVDELHKFKITKLNSTNDQRWQTYVIDSSKKTGRRLIKTAEKMNYINGLLNIMGLSKILDL